MSNLVDRLRASWQQWSGEEDTPFDGDLSAWTISTLIHMGLAILLAFYGLYYTSQNLQLVLDTDPEEELIDDEIEKIIEEVYFDPDDMTDDVGANSMA
ncbi:MAG: hypothetical protein N2C14_03295, partial [Planctomycetales bacterium]